MSVCVSWRSTAVSAVGVLAAAVVLHNLQTMLAGHDLVRVLGGHGLEVLPLASLSPAPVLTLALAIGLTVALVRDFVQGQSLAAPMTQAPAQPGCPLPSPAMLAPRSGALSRHLAERAPPHFAR